MGSSVPADSATLHVFDNVHTRMGASDSIQRGRSTFLEELSEASAIIRGASAHSLVIMDELGRGTSTHDGVAIAYATLHNLLVEKRALSLFVTHYPQIAELKKEFPSEIGTYFVSYLAEEATRRPPGGGPADVAKGEGDLADANAAEEAAQKVTFLYKLVPGVAPRSFGLHVARLAEVS
jgi:DNA mismatch repair protein MSH3